MSGGDTLIFGNGTYTGSSNRINSYVTAPPAGTSGAYTTIKAENTGGVLFDGQNTTTDLFKIQPTTSGTQAVYLTFQGLTWGRTGAEGYGTVWTSNASYVKFLQCGAYDPEPGNDAVFVAQTSAYILFEGCYAYGLGRYKFLTYGSNNIIFRNCVGRHDAVNDSTTNNPMAVYSMYDSNNILVQNSIAIDSDQASFYDYTETSQYGGCFAVFDTSATTTNVTYTNCACLNSAIGGAFIASNNSATNITYSNNVFWGLSTLTPDPTLDTNRSPIVWSRATSASFTNNTFGGASDTDSTGNVFFAVDSGTTDIYSSIFDGITLKNSSVNLIGLPWIGATGTFVYGYGDYYNDVAALSLQTGDVTTNPTTKWPVLSCTNSTPWSLSGSTSMCGKGQSGSNIGANLIYQQGASGTIWGQTGYNLQQDGTNGQSTVYMWPFPNESVIKTQMAAYTGASLNSQCTASSIPWSCCTGSGTGSCSINGARGFATASTDSWGQPVTLTSYIWQYLGNQIPSSIYSAPAPLPAPNVAPVVSYTVTASASGGGSITPASATVTSGNPITFTITPGSGSFVGLTVNGQAVTATAAGNGTYTYKIPSVQEYENVQATFTP